MQKVIILKGLPGSGKSTWAKEFVATNPTYKRINKDDLRAMLDNGKWSKEREKFIVASRDELIITSLVWGFNVIVDDTNLEPKHEARIRELLAQTKTSYYRDGFKKEEPIEVEVKLFDTPLQECIKRDLVRPNPVGEKVIYQMWEKHLKPKPLEHDPKKDDCIIVDIDGTLAKMNGRSAYDYSKVGEDTLVKPIANLVKRYSDLGYRIVIVSGRKNFCRKDTGEWLTKHGVAVDQLFMRGDDDNRKDSIIKQETLHRYILPNYNVEFVLDDRDQVVEMWRAEGLTCLQVNYGNF